MSATALLLTQSMTPSDFADNHALHEVWDWLRAYPVLGALVTVVFSGAFVRRVRDAIHRARPRDPMRTFGRADKRAILARAGGRCEHHSPLFGRCDQTLRLEADHVHPHSRGGWTTRANGQALCRRHNKAKAARVPWTWQLNRLAGRRATYFPLGMPTEVMRHPERRRVRVPAGTSPEAEAGFSAMPAWRS